MYTSGLVYTVQDNAWMNSNVRDFYAKSLLNFEIDAPALLLLDNFERRATEEAGC